MQVKIVKDLSLWFQKNARTLPWRERGDPYSVWLSEIMLQQTQVATVIPYFNRFVERYPKVQDLANASLEDVYQLWAGLGYYSRARNLHRGAQHLAKELIENGKFPETREAWLQVPGVGEYTAGAVLSIAFQKREALVDGNVVRVLSRIYAIKTLDTKKTKIWDYSRELVNAKNAKPKILNQALMELGALICRPKNPKCEVCPVAAHCKGKKKPELYPEPKAKTVWKRVQEEKWILVTPSKNVFLVQNAKGGWREGLWDFPNPRSLKELKKARLVETFVARYTVTTHKIERTHHWFQVAKAIDFKTGRWFSADDLPALPAPVKKVLKKVFL